MADLQLADLRSRAVEFLDFTSFTVYQNCPLPTPEDRLLFILAYVETYSLQVVQGRLFNMG